VSTWTGPQPFDRRQDRRSDPGWVGSLWPSARVLGVTGNGRLAASADGLEWATSGGTYDDQRHHLVGLIGDTAMFAEEVAEAPVSLRDVMDGLADAELELAFTAVALVGWHARARFCPVCGALTQAALGGLMRRCTGCGIELHPRTDPAVIVAIVDSDDRLLLGRQPAWPEGRYSVFAGFAEAGESLEQAVRREMAEEIGLELEDIAYLGSQPWPFPQSLMVGFRARAVAGDVRLLDGEIEHARWFTRPELSGAIASGEVLLPMKTSIANRMINSWLHGRLGSGSPGSI
jgi:NAD+ diphosphatase